MMRNEMRNGVKNNELVFRDFGGYVRYMNKDYKELVNY